MLHFDVLDHEGEAVDDSFGITLRKDAGPLFHVVECILVRSHQQKVVASIHDVVADHQILVSVERGQLGRELLLAWLCDLLSRCETAPCVSCDDVMEVFKTMTSFFKMTDRQT